MNENGYSTEAACLMEGECSLRKWPVERKENGHYRGGQFKGGRKVKLQKWSL